MTTIHLDDVRGCRTECIICWARVILQNASSITFTNILMSGCWLSAMQKERRRITQMAFYDNEGGRNTCTVLYDREGKTPQQIPEAYQRRFLRYGIENPYQTA